MVFFTTTKKNALIWIMCKKLLGYHREENVIAKTRMKLSMSVTRCRSTCKTIQPKSKANDKLMPGLRITFLFYFEFVCIFFFFIIIVMHSFFRCVCCKRPKQIHRTFLASAFHLLWSNEMIWDVQMTKSENEMRTKFGFSTLQNKEQIGAQKKENLYTSYAYRIK